MQWTDGNRFKENAKVCCFIAGIINTNHANVIGTGTACDRLGITATFS